ncbi:MAG TPA: PPK2 family polyphosphate kinase [Candidatus Limnocylindrales bacterium]
MADTNALRDAFRVKPGKRVRLEKLDPGATYGHDKISAVAATALQMARLRDLQDRLWAESKHSVLVVLQGIDAAGKDGTIAKVVEAFNPQGCPVTSFKVPTAEELAHDFLWRVHQRTPGLGEIGIFNRSHYEDVLVVRVHHLVPKEVWSKRYDDINAFERTLTEGGTTIVKFFLTIDRDEQRRRIQERYDDPKKRWKFKMADLDERKLWDDYQKAFDDALSKTSTAVAPWYVIPANRHWFRNLAVATILADVIADLKPDYPPEPDLPKDLVIE